MSEIDDPVSFFTNLGGLHDARVEQLCWQEHNRQISIRVDDANANFLGLPGYMPLASEFVFERVEALEADLHIDGSFLAIYELVTEVKGDRLHISIGFAPYGKMSFVCADIAVREKAV